MKQRSSGAHHYSPRYHRNDEIEVAAILLELPALIVESDSALRLPLSWGAKRRRSANEPSFLHGVRLPSPSVPSIHGSGSGGGSGVLVSCAFESEKPAVKVGTSSPATPLSFSPSESDEKRKRLKRKASVKKTKEHWLEVIEKYTKSNESLAKDIAQMKCYYEKMKENNLLLQARKQELSLGFRREMPGLEAESSSSLDMRLEQTIIKASNSLVGHEFHSHRQHHQLGFMVDQRPLISDRTVNETGIIAGYPYPNDGQTVSLFPGRSHGLGMKMNMNDNMGPSVVPDLNVAPGESLWMDFTKPIVDDRTMSAQARQRRMQICRHKKSNSTTKLRILNRR